MGFTIGLLTYMYPGIYLSRKSDIGHLISKFICCYKWEKARSPRTVDRLTWYTHKRQCKPAMLQYHLYIYDSFLCGSSSWYPCIDNYTPSPSPPHSSYAADDKHNWKLLINFVIVWWQIDYQSVICVFRDPARQLYRTHISTEDVLEKGYVVGSRLKSRSSLIMK